MGGYAELQQGEQQQAVTGHPSPNCQLIPGIARLDLPSLAAVPHHHRVDPRNLGERCVRQGLMQICAMRVTDSI